MCFASPPEWDSQHFYSGASEDRFSKSELHERNRIFASWQKLHGTCVCLGLPLEIEEAVATLSGKWLSHTLLQKARVLHYQVFYMSIWSYMFLFLAAFGSGPSNRNCFFYLGTQSCQLQSPSPEQTIPVKAAAAHSWEIFTPCGSSQLRRGHYAFSNRRICKPKRFPPKFICPIKFWYT